MLRPNGQQILCEEFRDSGDNPRCHRTRGHVAIDLIVNSQKIVLSPKFTIKIAALDGYFLTMPLISK